jgi:hypothetical protein
MREWLRHRAADAEHENNPCEGLDEHHCTKHSTSLIARHSRPPRLTS